MGVLEMGSLVPTVDVAQFEDLRVEILVFGGSTLLCERQPGVALSLDRHRHIIIYAEKGNPRN